MQHNRARASVKDRRLDFDQAGQRAGRLLSNRLSATVLRLSDQREYIGQVVRLTVDFIEERGLGPKVREKLSPDTARVLAKPPWPFAWVPAAPMDELESLVGALGGRQASVDLGLLAARKMGGTLMQPVIKMAMNFFGSSPATVFGNLDRFYAMATRGWHFTYQPLSDKSGVVEARTDSQGVPAAIADVMRGNFSYVFELCGVEGEVGAPEVVRLDADGAQVRFTMQWL